MTNPDMDSRQPAIRDSGWPEYLVTAAIAAVVIWQLMIPPLIGMADNGDFPRVMRRFDIGYLTDDYRERYFEYFLAKYRVDEKDHWDSHFISSQTLLVAMALPINELFSRDGYFDIRSLALVHLALEITAAWLLLVYTPVQGQFARIVFIIILFLVLTDAGYVSFFSSFYSEPGSFLFLLITLGLVMKITGRASIGALLIYCLAGLLFITSKPQNVLPGVTLALFSVRLCALRKGQTWRWTCYSVSGCFLSGALVYYTLTPVEGIIKPSYYLSVFYEILPYSPSPRQDLIELGLDPDLAKYMGTIPFVPSSPTNDPHFQRAFFDKMSFSKVIRFHLAHPLRLMGTLDRSAHYAPLLRPGLGNYEKSAGFRPFTISQSFDAWSSLRRAYSPGTFAGFLLFFTVGWAGVAFLHLRTHAQPDLVLLELMAALFLMAVLEFVSVVIAQGTYESVKHLFLFDILVDISFTMGVIWAAIKMERLLAARRSVSA